MIKDSLTLLFNPDTDFASLAVSSNQMSFFLFLLLRYRVIMGRKHDIHSAGPYTASLMLCQFSFNDKDYKASQVGFDIFQTFGKIVCIGQE